MRDSLAEVEEVGKVLHEDEEDIGETLEEHSRLTGRLRTARGALRRVERNAMLDRWAFFAAIVWFYAVVALVAARRFPGSGRLCFVRECV